MRKLRLNALYRITSVCLLLIAASCHHQPSVVAANPRDTLYIYIMAGQSNMAGRGVIEPQDTLSDPRILSMDQSGHFVVAREPLHFYEPSIAGLDCGMSFGRELLPHLQANTRIGLIPCAVGSSSVEEWLTDYPRIVHLYSNLLTRCREGQRYGVIKGILWHQGEAEAGSNDYPLYESRLKAFVLKLRSDLGVESLPFLAGRLAAFCRYPHRDVINAGITDIAAQLPFFYAIETADLSGKPDSLHFDSEGQRELGRRFARVVAGTLH